MEIPISVYVTIVINAISIAVIITSQIVSMKKNIANNEKFEKEKIKAQETLFEEKLRGFVDKLNSKIIATDQVRDNLCGKNRSLIDIKHETLKSSDEKQELEIAQLKEKYIEVALNIKEINSAIHEIKLEFAKLSR
jgi:peptidoglycan hydrolase CwlO-like protein